MSNRLLYPVDYLIFQSVDTIIVCTSRDISQASSIVSFASPKRISPRFVALSTSLASTSTHSTTSSRIDAVEAMISRVAEKRDEKIRRKDAEVRMRDTRGLMDCVRSSRSNKSSVGVGALLVCQYTTLADTLKDVFV